MASQSSEIYYIVDNTAEEVEYDNGRLGTSVLFMGDHERSSSLVVTIDDNAPSSLLLHSSVYGQFYQSLRLDDTAKLHTINATVVGPVDSIALDYIAVSPRKETPLIGRTLMIDDMYSDLSFGSGWVTTTETVFNLFDFLVFPFQNTTHTTSTLVLCLVSPTPVPTGRFPAVRVLGSKMMNTP
ncbi:hypothetical protein C8J56DRAFT_894845 [Mycena floridula]|nr:hypothetical protein C8J56DRAFT_894845 [Mycena floridula]